MLPRIPAPQRQRVRVTSSSGRAQVRAASARRRRSIRTSTDFAAVLCGPNDRWHQTGHSLRRRSRGSNPEQVSSQGAGSPLQCQRGVLPGLRGNRRGRGHPHMLAGRDVMAPSGSGRAPRFDSPSGLPGRRRCALLRYGSPVRSSTSSLRTPSPTTPSSMLPFRSLSAPMP